MLIYPNHLGAIGSVKLVWARRGTLQTFNNKGVDNRMGMSALTTSLVCYIEFMWMVLVSPIGEFLFPLKNIIRYK